ncbi:MULTISPECIES: ATP-binding protein [unclassified Streptomyces]|uniref:ATP-binding protein n=1 Tax=Streptomyces sp. SID8354 TaxID=2690339 RepID=UPI0003A745D0|nr:MULTISPECIES: ATP-binding protein [unclassified Streptomyces]
MTKPRVPAVPSRWTFPATAASVRRARWAVAGALPADCAPQLAADLVLLASELVTNAVRHGTLHGDDREGQRVELFLWPADGHYWLAVSDAGDGHPVVRASDPDIGCGGRGLVLVDAVSAAWAVMPRRPCGKSVVAGMPLREKEEEGPQREEGL